MIWISYNTSLFSLLLSDKVVISTVQCKKYNEMWEIVFDFYDFFFHRNMKNCINFLTVAFDAMRVVQITNYDYKTWISRDFFVWNHMKNRVDYRTEIIMENFHTVDDSVEGK